MRHARPQGREDGRARRDRTLARRRTFRKRTIDVAFLGEAFLRIAGAIVLETLAFIIWNVGTRSPLTVLRDVRAAFGNGPKMFAGLITFVIGAIFVAAATTLLLPALSDVYTDFLPAELFSLLVALAVEHIVGNDVRELTGTRIEQP